ncbi:MAG TPA: DoxX family protein [Mycobacteriales bacterium]|nr:DoxX family protein [Mycobacteriales bacterium]
MNRYDAAVLVLRLAVGLTLVAHGLNHAFGGGRLPGAARWFEGLGLRHGRLQALTSAVVEVAGGTGLAVGLLTSFAAAALVGVMVVAGVIAHRRNGFFVFKDGYEYVLVLATTCVALAVAGPGRASLDRALGLDTKLSGWVGLIVALGLGVGGAAALLAGTWRPPARS